MRKLLAITGAVLILACGSDKSTSPKTGELIFKLDAVTCVGTGTLELYIDGTSQGQYTMSAGSQKGFTVVAGPHTAGAREVGVGGYVWATQSATVPAGSTYSAVLAC